MISNTIFSFLDSLIRFYIGHIISFLLIVWWSSNGCTSLFVVSFIYRLTITLWEYYCILPQQLCKRILHCSLPLLFGKILLSSFIDRLTVTSLRCSSQLFHPGKILLPSLFNHFMITIWAYSTILLSFIREKYWSKTRYIHKEVITTGAACRRANIPSRL
jgi:hypothetical protein